MKTIYRLPDTWPQHGDKVADIMTDSIASQTGAKVKKLHTPKDEALDVSFAKGAVCIAVCWGIRPQTSRWINALETVGVPTLVLDQGYIGRAKQFGAMGYYQVNIGCLNRIRTFVTGDTVRLDEAMHYAGLSWGPPPQKDHGNVLVLGQVENDAQHGLAVPALTRQLKMMLREASARGRHVNNVCFRPHPLAEEFTTFPSSSISRESLDLDIERASTVVSYNSTALINAILARKPIFCDPSSIYHQAVVGSPERLLRAISWSQWTLNEMVQGVAWRATLKTIGI